MESFFLFDDGVDGNVVLFGNLIHVARLNFRSIEGVEIGHKVGAFAEANAVFFFVEGGGIGQAGEARAFADHCARHQQVDDRGVGGAGGNFLKRGGLVFHFCHGEAVKDGETSQRVEDVVEARLRYHIQMAGDRPKDVLRPYVAARRAKCVKLMSVDEFNRHYATNVAKSSYSDWVGENPKYCYSDDELKPYEDEFLRLKEGTLPSPVGT